MGRTRYVSLLCWVTMEAPDVEGARRKLDAFREAVRPTSEYGLMIFEDRVIAAPLVEDLEQFDAEPGPGEEP